MTYFGRMFYRKSYSWMVALFAIFILTPLANAKEPSVVTLLYFRGIGLNNAIRLEWATGTELHTVGFRIERSGSSAGPFVLLGSIGFVPSEAPPDGLSGAEYEAIDSSDTTNGTTYWYRLVEVEGSGAENRSDPISVTAGLATPTSTSTATPTRTPTTASTAGSTAAPGFTSTPVSTRQPGIPLTPTPTPLTDSRGTPISRADSTRVGLTDLTPADGDSSFEGVPVVIGSGVQSTVSGYPGPESATTPQPNLRNGFEGYPALSQDEFFGLPDAYPAFPEENRSARAVEPQNDASADTGPAAIGRGNTPDSSQESAQSEQDPVATLMLWVGFLAALVIFLAAVMGSAYIYRRQSPK